MGRRCCCCWRLGCFSAWAACALLAGLALEQGQKCGSTRYEHEGRCCDKCPPGERVAADCSEGVLTLCVPCKAHHFQGDWTQEKECIPHRDCHNNLAVHIAGDATQNTECRCKNGTHCSSQECLTCRKNNLCGPGKGVQQEATSTSDTVCEDCPHGYFSSILSATAPCQPWSSCEASRLVKKANGTRESDVVCGDLPTSEERKRIVLTVVLISFAVLAGSIGLLVWHRTCRERRKLRLDEDPQALPAQKPAEVDEDEFSALPVQETLPGSQPVAQEDGKESRLAEQERP